LSKSCFFFRRLLSNGFFRLFPGSELPSFSRLFRCQVAGAGLALLERAQLQLPF
jgi:hypothetical protein